MILLRKINMQLKNLSVNKDHKNTGLKSTLRKGVGGIAIHMEDLIHFQQK
jgi:hypothetical protein